MIRKGFFKPLTWFTALGYLFLYLPICVLIAFSFNTSRFSVVWKSFTVQWYIKLLHDPLVLHALKNSLVVAVVATDIGSARRLSLTAFFSCPS